MYKRFGNNVSVHYFSLNHGSEVHSMSDKFANHLETISLAMSKPFENCFVIIGGKYTTFRVMVQDIARPIVLNNGKSYNNNLTMNPFAKESKILSFKENELNREIIDKVIAEEQVQQFEDLLIRRLYQNSENHLSEKNKELVLSYKDQLKSI